MAPTFLQYLLLLFTVSLVLETSYVGAANLGVCYTRSGSNAPLPAEAVRLYQTYKIGRMRIYEPDHEILEALNGSTIQLTVGVPSHEIGTIATNHNATFQWFKDHIRPYAPHVRFRYVVVGHSDVVNARDAQVVLQAMKNLDAIINQRYHMHIRITTEVTFKVIEKMIPPRKSSFTVIARPFMEPIVRFLAVRDTPLFIKFYPYFIHYNPEYELTPLDANKYFTTKTYFDFVKVAVDMVYGAMEKVEGGAGNVKVVVGETGWPSTGGEGASVRLAREYVWALAEHALSTRGTPMRPRRQMEVYVYELFNGIGKRAGSVHWNFGMFDTDKKPVYGVPPMK